MNLSATQLEMAEMCGRKWLFRYRHRLPEIKKGDSTSFGNVLHSVCERYLKGASLDELFPPGWDVCPDAKKAIAPIDSALIQVLIPEAIKNGVLERRPGGEVEKEFSIECAGHTIRGKKDFVVPDRIEDHKNSKSVRYFKSAEGLKKTLQMMTYAKDNLENEYRKKGKVPPRFFTLVHNQYLRNYDSPTVRRREAEVTPAEIDAFWDEKIVPLVKGCERLTEIASPFHVPEPDKGACEAFGGCSYVSICHNGEEMLTYKARVSKFQNPQQQLPQMTTSPADFLAKRNAQLAASSPAAVNPPAAVQLPPAAAATAPAPAGDTPPWFDPDCPLCKRKQNNKGFNGEGRPCRICLSKNPRGADDYDLSTDSTGKILWTKKGAPAQGGGTQVVQAATTTATRVSLGIDDMVNKLKAATTVDAVAGLFEEAEKVLGAGSAEFLTWTATAEKRMEQLAAPAAPAPRTITDPTPTTITPIQTTIAPSPEVAAMIQTAQAAVAATAASEAPPKRKPGRPRKSAVVPAVVGQPVEDGDEDEGEGEDQGLTLMIGCSFVKKPEGRKVLFAEEILKALPGYWENSNVFQRRDQLTAAVHAIDSEMLKSLSGAIVVQHVENPDVNNFISALLPHATTIISGLR